MKSWEPRPRQPLTGAAIAAGLGIVAADFWVLPIVPLVAASVMLAVLLLLRPRTLGCWLFIAMAFAALHTSRHRYHPARSLAETLTERPKVAHVTGVVWSEPEAPRMWSKNVTARFRLKVEALQLGGVARPAAGILLNAEWAGPMPAYGYRIELTGVLRNIAPIRNPGQFDIPEMLHRRGVWSELQARFPSDCRIVAHGCGDPAQEFALRSRAWIKQQLDRDLEDAPHIAGLIQSMVLGMKGETPADAKELFQRTGTLHLFAVSGLNVAMLGALVWHFLKPLRVRRSAAVLLTIPVLVTYALVTGLSASCVRATLMGTLVLGAYLFDRQPVVYNSLSAAGLVILAWDTNELFSPGYQFSFALVFTIVWLAHRVQRKVEPLGQPDAFLPRPLWSWLQWTRHHASRLLAAAVGVTVAAWVGSLLFTAGYFHLFSPAAIPANLVAVPLAFCVLGLGLLSVIAAPVWSYGAILFNNANWLCGKALLGSVALFAATPGGHFYVETPRRARAPACEITVFDVEAGGAAHVRSGARDWLVDCGHGFHYEQIVLPYLRSRGVNRLDGLFLTHGDAQHMGGAVSVLDDLRPRQLVDSPLKDRSSTRTRFHAELAARKVGKAIAARGDVLEIAPGTALRVLFPPVGWHRTAADDKTFVVRLESAGAKVLFTSDSGFAVEQWLLQNEGDLAADILIKGQHAKDVSGTLDFIARVAPRAVVCGAVPFGAARDKLDAWEQSLAARGIAVFRQDRTGAVTVKLDAGGAIELRAFVGDQTFRSRGR